MQRRLPLVLFLVCLTLAAGAQTPPARAAAKAEPRRDLRVALRQVEDGGAGYGVGTQPRAPLLAPQQVQVRNGEQATLRLGQSIPVQWVRSVESRSAALEAGGATASLRGGGVTQELIWLEAGQSLRVRPHWPGGRQPVALEVEIQSAGLDAEAGAATPLPAQSRSQLATTVTVPLGEWVTLATSGAAPQRGVYGSEAAPGGRRLLQLRVDAAP